MDDQIDIYFSENHIHVKFDDTAVVSDWSTVNIPHRPDAFEWLRDKSDQQKEFLAVSTVRRFLSKKATKTDHHRHPDGAMELNQINPR